MSLEFLRGSFGSLSCLESLQLNAIPEAFLFEIHLNDFGLETCHGELCNVCLCFSLVLSGTNLKPKGFLARRGRSGTSFLPYLRWRDCC